MRKIVGITPSYSSEQLTLPIQYLEALETAGASPLVFPLMANEEIAENLVSLCDGFLFSGGPDINPSYYGENPWYALGSVSLMRDASEVLFYKAAVKTGKPILGICRGIQLLNVLEGGSLYQDLGTQYKGEKELLTHRQSEAGYKTTHEAFAMEGSLIEKCFGKKFAINTFHHQAVKVLGKGLEITAVATDGVIEAVTKPDYGFWNAVQWHPEIMAPQSEGARKLFKAFVDAM